MNTSPPTLPSPPSFSKYIRPDPLLEPEPEPEPELSIFDAKKYFNYEESNPATKQPRQHQHQHLINLPPAPPRLSSCSSIESSSYGGGILRNNRARSSVATPTASSEASWNSKTGLLSNPPGAIHVSINNCHKKTKSPCKWLFGTTSKCLCSGKKSVQVEDNYNKTPPPPHHHNFYNIKISPPTPTTTNAAFTFPDPPRESLEVFHPSRKDPIQSHRAVFPRQPMGFTFPVSPSKSRMGSTDIDDVASDASSDLFEIESFSTQTTTYPVRDSLDENPRLLYCHMEEEEEGGGEYYEPSEASIEWSVTTAEGFDRASVTNMSSVTAMEIDEMVMKTKRKERGGSSSLLMSCRCEKAVSVAVGPNPVESGTRHVSSNRGGGCNNKPPLARSRSSRLSVA